MIKKHFNQNIIFTALCTSITVTFSQIILPIPFSPIPITLGLLGVFISGGLLSPKWAVISQVIYICLGILGLPVFASFSGGLGVLAGPTGGFIIGYIFTALISSFIINKFSQMRLIPLFAMFLGLLACYACGTFWFMLYSHSSLLSSLSVCVLPFILGDFIKLFLAFAIILKLKECLPIFNV